jgi:hypothetical protein
MHSQVSAILETRLSKRSQCNVCWWTDASASLKRTLLLAFNAASFLEFPQKFRLNYLVYIRKSKVKNLQTEYFLMYQQYLKHAYSKETNTKFAGGLMLLHHSK